MNGFQSLRCLLKRVDKTVQSIMLKLGMYGYVWIYRGINGYLWVYMGMYGYIWVYMCVYGYVWVYMGVYGYVWVYMDRFQSLRCLIDIVIEVIEGLSSLQLPPSCWGIQKVTSLYSKS